MKKKQFKTESKKILDLMINSVYTNRDIFLRELISNASDAIDKLYYKSLTDDNVKVDKDEFCIKLDLNKEERVITITDNGIGMTEEELDENLGVIAKSGSSLFKEMYEKQEDINIIGQFGVGFYSAFMVAKEIRVLSKAYGSDEAYLWVSDGADGYEITKAEKDECGTVITLILKDNNDTENYDEYLEDRRITGIVKKYSDYVKYPIIMREESKDENDNKVSEDKTLNSMIPIWKRRESDITEEEYNSFYADKFYDFDAPVKTIHSCVEGQISYNSLLFVPSHAPYDYYTKDYEKGLQLYSNGVLIMDKCADLLPDYFSFIKGLVDSEDISLNLSRELLQQDRQLRLIAKSLEKKIKSSLEEMLEEDGQKSYSIAVAATGKDVRSIDISLGPMPEGSDAYAEACGTYEEIMEEEDIQAADEPILCFEFQGRKAYGFSMTTDNALPCFFFCIENDGNILTVLICASNNEEIQDILEFIEEYLEIK